MADLLGNPNFLRPTDSWSWTEMRSVKYSHGWTVKGFSAQSDSRYLETSFKPLPNDASLTFRIRLHPQGNKESNKDFTFFQVFCNTSSTRYRGKFTVYNSRNEEIATTVYMGQQQLHGYFEYTRRDLLINHLAPSDELQILLELNLTFDTVTKSTLSRQPIVESKPNEVARDFEQFFFSGSKHADFVIETAGERSIPAHRVVLIARSPVFAAMLEPHTEESQSGRVKFDDIDFDVMNEVLMYVYSGKSPNLKDMAPDLLPVADRFALSGLKDMAEQVMRISFTTDNVCRVLLLADMHGARELKQDAMSYLAQNSGHVIQTDGWRQLITSSPTLVTEVVSAISAEQPYPTSLSGSSCDPSPKRIRLLNQDRGHP